MNYDLRYRDVADPQCGVTRLELDMNVTEFAALRPGDKIVNHMTQSYGDVVAVETTAVLVRWAPGTHPRAYGANTTAWMHWDRVEAACTCDNGRIVQVHARGCPHDERSEATKEIEGS